MSAIKPIIAYKSSAFAMLALCALDGASGWGRTKSVWVLFEPGTGNILTWSCNKHQVLRAAKARVVNGKNVPSIIAKINAMQVVKEGR